jgi:hypothetical protein
MTVAAADPVGRFLVGWRASHHEEGSGDLGMTAGFAVRPLRGGWRQQRLSDSRTGGQPTFEHGAIDADYLATNRALIAWTARVGGRHRVRVANVVGASLRGVDTLSGPRDLADGAADLAIGPGRRAIVAWLETPDDGETDPPAPVPNRVMVSERQADGRFAGGQPLSSAERDTTPPSAAYGPLGEALVSWGEQLGADEWASFASSGP